MMQQVATSGSEIAALKGKAGKGTHDGADQGSAFDAMFQQAKSSSQKRTASETTSYQTSQKSETVNASSTAPGTSKSATHERENTGVPHEDNATRSRDTSSSDRVNEPKAAGIGNADDGVKSTMPVDPETDIPDDGNLVSMDPKEVKMTWDEWLASQEGEVDWLAYVDAVRQAKGDIVDESFKKGKPGDNGEILPVIPSPVSDNDVLEEGRAGQSEDHAAGIIPDAPDEETLKANIAVFSEVLVKSVNESGEPKPDDGKQEILPIMPIIEKLSELLAKQSQQQATGDSTESNMNEQIQALAAQLTGALKATQQGQSVAAKANTTENNLGFTINDLIASLKGEAEPSGHQADAELLLDLIQTEMLATAGGKADTTSVTSDNLMQAGAGTGSAEMAGEEAIAMRQLISDMMQLSDGSQSKVTQSLADKVVALLPPTASDQQQQTVKQAVIVGVQELQSQLSQGHEPGIDLKAIIADAIKEANIPVTSQMMTQAEQQVSQLHQLLSTAQSAAHQSATAQMASADTVIQENTQVRTEATKAQHQADSMDKPVNITKAEGLQQLNEKIRWMMSARNMMAEIRLDPPELGSMQVRVNMSGDTASVNFVVQSQQARDALADATPRLRDMLAEQGIELGESFVQQQSSGQGETGENGDGQFAGGGSQSAGEDDTQIIEQPVTRESLGGIDYYA
ncbi:flagellar hook-length control protein FliK [Alteromonas sp. H39]|uniref:flagellar hook-length control protein FliK n=1 Tax=Alteromonas sp. H39 TaxID=3389876 RepID=UPI0039E096CE